MLIAEELDCRLVARARRAVAARARADRATAPGVTWKYGPQGAGGSTEHPRAWDDLRAAGAEARRLLVLAAAADWKRRCRDAHDARPGYVAHPDGRTLDYGALAADGGTIAVAEERRAAQGSEELPHRRHARARRRRARHRDRPRTLRASTTRCPARSSRVIARCPYFDGELVSFDATRREEGPRRARRRRAAGPEGRRAASPPTSRPASRCSPTTPGRAQGPRALKIEWIAGPARGRIVAPRSTQQCRRAAAGRGQARARGRRLRRRATERRDDVVEATYRVPFVAHAPMEPQNACAHVGRPTACTIVAPMQQPWRRLARRARDHRHRPHEDRRAHDARRRRLRPAPDATTSSPRRCCSRSRPASPSSCVWTREDDLRHDFFRPFGHHQLVAALDGDGRVTGWAHRLASASKYYRRADVKPEDHWTAELYPDDFPARLVPNLRMEWLGVQSGITRGSWRAPAHTANAFVVQSFLDEVAHATKQRSARAAARAARREPRASTTSSTADPMFDHGPPRARAAARGRAHRLGPRSCARPRARHRRPLHLRRLRRARDGGRASPTTAPAHRALRLRRRRRPADQPARASRRR